MQSVEERTYLEMLFNPQLDSGLITAVKLLITRCNYSKGQLEQLRRQLREKQILTDSIDAMLQSYIERLGRPCSFL